MVKRAARSFLLVGLLLVLLAMFGCAANSVHMDDSEAKACRSATTGCSVWTEEELRTLAQQWFKKGYHYGWKDANEQAARDL